MDNKITLNKVPEELYPLISNYKDKIVSVSGDCPKGYLKNIYKVGDSYRLCIKMEGNGSGEYRYRKNDLENIVLDIWE